MIIATTIGLAQLAAVRDDILIAIKIAPTDLPTAINTAQIAANNLNTLISEATIGVPMPGIPVADVTAIRDALTKLIDGEMPPPPPPVVTQIVPGDGQSLTNAGHVWTFGAPPAQNPERGSVILRDGVQYASGVASLLVLATGVIWAQALGKWYRDNGSFWVDGGTGPVLTPPPLTPPPPPPSGSGASPDGTTITAPAVGQSIVDAGGHVWTFGTEKLADAHFPGPDWNVLKDGQPPSYGGAAASMQIKANVIWLRTAPNRWSPSGLLFKDNGSGWDLIEGTI